MSASSVPPELLPYLLGQKTDYSSYQDSIIKVNVVFISLMILTTGLRFWVRFRMVRAAGLDDILMILALLFAILLSASCLLGERFGLGKHIWNLTPNLLDIPEHVGLITKTLYGCYLSYATAITFIKYSIMATYFRIFPKGILRHIVVAIGVVVTAIWICNIFAIIFTCVPIQAAWNYNIKGYCFPIVNFFYASSSFNITTDLLLCFLPLPTLWALSMPKPQRVVLCFLFSMGAFACVASILRLTQLHNLTRVDVTYTTITSLNWSVIEVGTAIMCASLSALRPLASHYLPALFSHLTMHTHGTQKGIKFNSITNVSKTGSSRTGGRTFDDEGQIYVSQTFDVCESRDGEWDGRIERVGKRQEGNCVVVRAKDSKESVGPSMHSKELFERSSEEELVHGRRASIIRGNRR